jgi:hypothetical protein
LNPPRLFPVLYDLCDGHAPSVSSCSGMFFRHRIADSATYHPVFVNAKHTCPQSTEACRPGLRISVPCRDHHVSESEADAARQFPPPDMSLYMSLGFPSKRTTRSIFLRIPIRFGKRKLAQEGSPLARKRSSMNILAVSPCSPAGVAFAQRGASPLGTGTRARQCSGSP